MLSNQPLVPRLASGITPNWISSVLKLKDSITQNSFKVSANASAGNGFMSTLVRVEFELESNLTNPSEATKYSLIVKLLPDPSKVDNLEIVLGEQMDKAELTFYTDFIPEVQKIVPELSEYICEHYYACIQDEVSAQAIPYASVLILKDLKPESYFITPFHEGFDSNLFRQGLKFTAAFHVGSRCLERERGKTLPEFLPWLSSFYLPNEQRKAGCASKVDACFDKVFQIACDILSKYSQEPGKYVAAYQELGSHAKDIYQLVLTNGKKVRTGIHGDLWGANILSKESAGGKLKIIDWQFFGYADPAFDMSVYIVSMLQLENLNPSVILEFAKEYYSLYTDLCYSKGLSVERNLEEFMDFFSTYGMAFCLFGYVMGCPNLVGLEGAIPKLVRILEIFVEMDVVKFLVKTIL